MLALVGHRPQHQGCFSYCFGTREHKYLGDLFRLFSVFKIKSVFCDENFAYQSRVKESAVLPGKRNTQRIERKHLSSRTWRRLVRKGIRFSKSKVMHHIVVGLIINFWFFKRKLPIHLL
jgi:insertion element IS1 protein InsB